jgi:nucleolar GTP-binding protein
MLAEHRAKKKTADNKPVVPRRHDIERQFNTSRMGRHLSSLGLDPTAAVNRARSKSANGTRSRKRDRSEGTGGDDMEVDEQSMKKMRSRPRSLSRPHKEALPGNVSVPVTGFFLAFSCVIYQMFLHFRQ